MRSSSPADAAADPVFNPHLRLTPVLRDGALVALRVAAPARGQPLRRSVVSPDDDPTSFAILARIAAREDGVDAELTPTEWARLVELGVLVPPDALARAVRFRCSPFGPPGELVPRRWSPAAAPPRERLRVNGTLRYADDAGALAGWDGAPFAEGPAWARVDHAGAPLPSFYSLDGASGSLVQRLSPGSEPPPDLTPHDLEALTVAGILVDPAEAARGEATWGGRRAEAAARLARDRWTVVGGLVHAIQLAALRRYYRALVDEGHVGLGDRQVDLRYTAHDEPLARVIHRQLEAFVSDLAGEPFQPSYVYFSSYRPGATLAPHTDRPQCELSISLLLDYTPEPDDVSPWPLYLGAPGSAVPVSLGLGDGLVYRGRELTHFRKALPAGHTSTSLFLHYVPASFTGQRW